jgi:hypothetical protein
MPLKRLQTFTLNNLLREADSSATAGSTTNFQGVGAKVSTNKKKPHISLLGVWDEFLGDDELTRNQFNPQD